MVSETVMVLEKNSPFEDQKLFYRLEILYTVWCLVDVLTLAPAGVWANLEPAGGGLISAPPPWDLENYATHREAVNGVR